MRGAGLPNFLKPDFERLTKERFKANLSAWSAVLTIAAAFVVTAISGWDESSYVVLIPFVATLLSASGGKWELFDGWHWGFILGAAGVVMVVSFALLFMDSISARIAWTVVTSTTIFFGTCLVRLKAEPPYPGPESCATCVSAHKAAQIESGG